LFKRPEEMKQLGRPGVGGRILLKWIFKREDGETCTGLIWLWTGTGSGLL
jgi:hypothetical protein